LKGVNVTARKSILTVAIKNSGQSDFSFNPDSFAVSENNHKLSEAAMRADFETTLVQPSQEVQGTITIFGRPWNDRLTVSLSDGTRNLQMHR
jgi:archaellum component FlaG (FlaF/FlaG flagellin family)